MKLPLAAKVLGAAVVLAPAVSATWSIVAVNTRTGEVCVASATCIEGIDLQGLTPVVRIGLGGACAQSLGDSSGLNRARIWNDLIAGMTPQQILDDLAQNDLHHQSRQYGIVNMADEPLTFSGSSDGMAYYGVARVVDDYRYAIQGNVLTGIQVITNAEDAFLSTKGDLSEKVLAAMEGARVFGGDGRCSCSYGAPMYCGCPPPHFTYSAFTGFFILARMGDVDGATCDGATGCANGQYFCDLRSISYLGGPEPVLDLEAQYATWRAAQLGEADHIQTRVSPSAGRLPADGVSQATVDVELRDIDGNLVTANPATLSIVDVSGTPVATVGPVQLVSPGLYRFPVTSTTQTGEGRWQITVQHPSVNVLLWPELVVAIDPPAELFAGFGVVSATQGARVPLWLDSGTAAAGRNYLILASASGTSPGTPFAGVTLPLNLDAVLRSSYASAGTGRYIATIGALDANGRASATFVASPNLLYPLLGRHVDWAAVVYGAPNHATVNDGFDVAP
jgi:hypothetical protein